jgi:hypothetical protein
LLVAQAISGEPKQSTTAPCATSKPASRMLTLSPAARSDSIPAGASTATPTEILPNIKANADNRACITLS